MNRCLASLLLFAGLLGPTLVSAQELAPIPPIKRLLPPPGIDIPADVLSELEAKLAALQPRIEKLDNAHHRCDIEIFTKAVAFALRFDEFYDKKDFDKARWALKQAEERLVLAEKHEGPWRNQTGLVVRGYRSSIDNSVQPFGLVIPEKHDFSKPCPLYVWLHGRGDKETDLHFVYTRAHNKGDIIPENAIVLHAFGRQCLGFKSAGEIDVLDAVNEARMSNLNIDGNKIALIGFSMGGAGAWHIGAHYAGRWAVVAPGAGFAETARYQNLKPSNYPPYYEQSLWGAYDVPCYVRNFFNTSTIAYSGEKDKQIQAARVMEEAFRSQGRTLTHLIGPGTGHQYHPETKKELLLSIKNALASRRSEPPKEVTLQTRTLRYSNSNIVWDDRLWARLVGMDSHWEDARFDAKISGTECNITTVNLTSFILDQKAMEQLGATSVVVDTQRVTIPNDPTRNHIIFIKNNRRWKRELDRDVVSKWRQDRKVPNLQGPIDDAFLDPFLVVTPSGKSAHPRVQQWVDFELAHFAERWQATFRGTLRIKQDTDVTADDMAKNHLICFGDATSNKIIHDSLGKLPVQWTADKLKLAGKSYDAATHVPLLIYPNPAAPLKYIVLNSGPTFREAHDRTNSLQNPKLPDWAIIDLTTPPDGEKPGKVVAADFFDEQWQIKEMKSQ